jgi:hypothetical protein
MQKVAFGDWDMLRLPLGLVDPSEPNIVHRDFVLRPMTGKIRQKALTGIQSKSATELLNDCLCAVTESIGPYVKPLPKLVLQLTPIDRTYILFCSKHAYRPYHEIRDRRCSGCGRAFNAKVPLKDLPVNVPELGKDVHLVDGSFSFEIRDPDNKIDSAILRYPNCQDEQEAYQQGRGKQAFGAAYYLLSRAIVSLNGTKGPYTPEEVAELDGHILEGLDNGLRGQAQIGIDLAIELTCGNSNCDRVTYEEAGVLDHFFGSSLPEVSKIIGASS